MHEDSSREMLCVCTAVQLRYTVGNWALLRVSVCKPKLQHSGVCHRHLRDLTVQEGRGGEVGTGEIRVVRMGETQTFLLFEQPYRSHISVCIGGGYFSFMAI